MREELDYGIYLTKLFGKKKDKLQLQVFILLCKTNAYKQTLITTQSVINISLVLSCFCICS